MTTPITIEFTAAITYRVDVDLDDPAWEWLKEYDPQQWRVELEEDANTTDGELWKVRETVEHRFNPRQHQIRDHQTTVLADELVDAYVTVDRVLRKVETVAVGSGVL